MTEQKRRILMTALIAGAYAILLLLGILYAVTEKFVFSASFRIYFRMLYIPLILYWFTKGLKNRKSRLYKRALWLCGIALFADWIVVDGIRYILSGGVSTVLFLPACAPLCAMVVVLCDEKKDNRIEKNTALWICIPLLILSIYFEIISFIR
ncbi:MAG: hypothetical protein IJY91_06680 [Oscillospiraceae bacterium]|nr:hypothetical protein [Oscillospiraceae bacterium]